MAKNDSTSDVGIFAGILFGVILTLAYVKFDFALPGWLKPIDQIKSFAIMTTAELAANENNWAELQRNIAVRLKEDASYYQQIDDATGKFITQEIIWQHRAVEQITNMRNGLRAVANNQSVAKHESLTPYIEKYIDSLPDKTRVEKAFIDAFLKQRFPGQSSQAIAAQMTQMSLSELLMRPTFHTTIRFYVPYHGKVKVEIMQKGKAVATLFEADAPSGFYRQYWDYRDSDGVLMPRNRSYQFRVSVNEALWRQGDIQPQLMPGEKEAS